jgi:hypothetical protein
LFLEGADIRWLKDGRSWRSLVFPDIRSTIQFSDHYEGDGAALFKRACAMGLEGIVSKRALTSLTHAV